MTTLRNTERKQALRKTNEKKMKMKTNEEKDEDELKELMINERQDLGNKTTGSS